MGAGRSALAAVLTAVIGAERELDGHPAGVRTHAIVGMGAMLFTIAGTYGFGQNHDSAGVAAQVVTGVGLLGGRPKQPRRSEHPPAPRT